MYTLTKTINKKMIHLLSRKVRPMTTHDRSGASPLDADRSVSRPADHDRADDMPADRHNRRHEGSLRHDEDPARDKFGGVNLGASFFGWIVAIGITIILTSIVGAVGAAIGFSGNVTQSDAERQAGTIGITAAVILLVVLMVGYYAGGYVAGRMSRYDGARQGLAVWLIGLVVTLVAIGLGAVFGSEYNLMDRVSLPRIPVALDQLGWGAVVTGAAVIILTLLASMAGGKIGRRYHDRVDRVATR